ncbi:MAG: thioredoxin domain-containing protein [Deltaproteobacteria bacterium]|nr:thioredoxin domain-containing protein [Deltaproteobacteria bacterium]
MAFKNKLLSNLVPVFIISSVLFVILFACSNQTAKAKPQFIFKDPPRAGIVAKIGNEEISEEALISDDKLDFFELKKKEYELKMDRLNKLLVDKLIGAEAKKAGLSTEEFINKKVVGSDIKITEKEYQKFVKDKRLPENQINAQIKEKIFSYMKTTKRQESIDAYVAKLTKSTPIEVFFKKPRMNVQVEVGNAPTFGGTSAPVTIVEFSDFQCPYCSRVVDTVSDIKKKYGKKVRFAFKHFPIPGHTLAKPASEASMCVNEQSTDKFWKYHDKMFKNQDKLDNANLEKYAKEVGADMKKFNECINSKKYKNHVEEDLKSNPMNSFGRVY